MSHSKQPNIVEFSSLSALPQDANNIYLECHTYYHWLGTTAEYTTKSIVFAANCDCGLIGQSILDAPIVYTGTGTFLKTPIISDLNGAVIDNGDGTVRLTTTADHPFIAGNTILISNTINYNGYYVISSAPTTTTFDITETYVSETLSNGVAKAGIKSIRLQNITFAAPAGTLFDITGLSRLSTFIRTVDVITSNVANLGSIDTISLLSDNLQFDDFGQGLVANNARVTVTSPSFSNPKTTTKNQDCTFTNATNIVNATAHYMYDNDLVRLTTDGTLPTGLRAGVIDLNLVTDNSDGTVTLTTTVAHGFLTGETIFIPDTTNYKGFHEILDVPTTTTIVVKAPYVAETLSNNTAQQVYFIVNKTTDTFQLSKTKGGAVVTFTTDGTGNHEFFENTIGLTMRGSEYSFTLEKPVFAGSPYTFTAWKFEPTISTPASRGSILNTAYDLPNEYNHFTNGGLNQAYKYFSVKGTKGGVDSKHSGVVYSTGNTSANQTPLTGGAISEITQGTFGEYNMERTSRTDNRLYNENQTRRTVKVTAIISLDTNVATEKKIRMHILKNGVDATVAEPIFGVKNAFVTIVDTDIIEWEPGDYLSIGISNETDDTPVTVAESKLIVYSE